MSTGELTWEEFLQNSTEFLKKSEQLNDSWSFEYVTDDPGGSFLRYKRFNQLKPGAKTILFEYHILYSLSYSVPMLYFNLQDTEGNVMTLEEFLEVFLNRVDVDRGEIDLKTALTQMEHPLLFQPFLAIHPCQTATILDKSPASRNKILTFISTFGPLVFLDLDLLYGKD